MTHAVRSCIFTLCLAILSAGPALTQEQSSKADPAATVTAADVAYVYVGTANGVYLYDAAANGKLTLVSGSPFKIAGTASASNGKYFISSDTYGYGVYSYSVASNGALGEQKSEIDTQNYYGTDCGWVTAAILDHTGQNLYVQLNPESTSSLLCVAYQTYDVDKSSGALTFNGAAVQDSDDPWGDGDGAFFTFTITANDAFAYTAWAGLSALQRQSDGSLQYINFNETDPPPYQGTYSYLHWNVAADPTNHLAMGLLTAGGADQVMASYTVDAQGNIASTNTSENMPIAHLYPTGVMYPTSFQMSPSGKLLAVASDFQPSSLQVFHFNGADPITPYSHALTADPINQLQWDNNDHLYALSKSANRLHVFTVTPTSISEAPGSPFKISGTPNALVVVSNLCHAPATPGVKICVPASGSSVSSPVLVEAASNVTGTIVSTQLWVDGVKNFNAPGSDTLTTSVSLAAGAHRFAVIATNTAGQKWESTVTATVK